MLCVGCPVMFTHRVKPIILCVHEIGEILSCETTMRTRRSPQRAPAAATGNETTYLGRAEAELMNSFFFLEER